MVAVSGFKHKNTSCCMMVLNLWPWLYLSYFKSWFITWLYFLYPFRTTCGISYMISHTIYIAFKSTVKAKGTRIQVKTLNLYFHTELLANRPMILPCSFKGTSGITNMTDRLQNLSNHWHLKQQKLNNLMWSDKIKMYNIWLWITILQIMNILW